MPPSLQNGDLTSTESKLYEAKAEITCNQIAKKYFEGFVKRRFFVKGDKDDSISNNCGNAKEYILSLKARLFGCLSLG